MRYVQSSSSRGAGERQERFLALLLSQHASTVLNPFSTEGVPAVNTCKVGEGGRSAGEGGENRNVFDCVETLVLCTSTQDRGNT